MTFEEQLRRLEYIVDALDRGDEPLEKLLALYEEGISLARTCRDYLENAEQKIIEIKNSSEQKQRKTRKKKISQSENFEEKENFPDEDIFTEKKISRSERKNSSDEENTDEEPELPF